MAEEARNTRKPRPKRTIMPMRSLMRGFAILTMICIISGCIVASVMTVYVINTLDKGDSIKLEDVKLSFSTIIYAANTETGEFEEIQQVQSIEKRIWVDYDDIPQSVKDAAVAVEDKRFWTHSGIDFKRTVSAALNYLNPMRDESFGGSTITQQVVKNVTNDKQESVERKLREIFRAINLQKNYSKEQILEVYLNTIALANAQNGVQSASYLYFGKSVSEVTVAEAASLIAITQNPSKWDPFKFPENNRKRQIMILDMMKEQNHPDGTAMLTQEEYDTAIAQKMVFKEDAYRETQDKVQNWFIDTVYEEVLDDLVSVVGYTRTGASDALRTGGFRIYTTVDVEMQDYLEKKFIDLEKFPTIRNEVYPEGAFVVLDLNGEIKAIVGSNRKKEGARLFNRATRAVRHPGSTIKPLTAYAPAIEHDLIYWSMVWDDSPILLKPDDPTSTYPKNFYTNPSYRGPITITEAIQRSTNTIPVKLVQLLTPRTSFNFLRDTLHFSNLVESKVINGRTYTDLDLAPMALGAMTGGVTPLEMAAAYQMFGNGGLYNAPHSYTKVLDSEGNIILENKVIPQRVISAETATIMNKLLQKVTNSAPGTGTPAKFSDMPIAGKTGTSTDDFDEWFIGVTPYYVGVCWLGYDISETIDYRGFYYPPPIIWKNIMAPIHAKLKVTPFETSGNVFEREYCTESGHLSSSSCTTKSVGWYKASYEPLICTLHDAPAEDHDRDTGDGSAPPVDPDDDLAYWRWLYGNDGNGSSSSPNGYTIPQ